MDFEWDEAKAAANLAKHGVSFPYATRAFLDPYRLEELRYRLLGMVENWLLLVVYTYRRDAIRLISARRATRHEKRYYQEV